MSIRQIKLISFLMSFAYVDSAYAVFYTAKQYTHPQTGKKVVLLGDVHVDFDPQMTISQMHKHVVLEQAARHNAHLIVENVSPFQVDYYTFGFLHALSVFYTYQTLKNNDYVFAALGVAQCLFVRKIWYDYCPHDKKPIVSFEKHCAKLKAKSVDDLLPVESFSPLYGLVENAHQQGISARDVEFRCHILDATQATNVLSERLENEKLNSLVLKSKWLFRAIMRAITNNQFRYPLTVKDYCDIQDTIIAEIRSYKDDQKLVSIYNNCIQSYLENWITPTLRAICSENPHMLLPTVLVEIAKQTNVDMKMACDHFAIHNGQLLDALIIHEMYQKQLTHPTIFICAGGGHLENVYVALEALGFKVDSIHGLSSCAIYKALDSFNDNKKMPLKYLETLALDLQKFFDEIK